MLLSGLYGPSAQHKHITWRPPRLDWHVSAFLYVSEPEHLKNERTRQLHFLASDASGYYTTSTEVYEKLYFSHFITRNGTHMHRIQTPIFFYYDGDWYMCKTYEDYKNNVCARLTSIDSQVNPDNIHQLFISTIL